LPERAELLAQVSDLMDEFSVAWAARRREETDPRPRRRRAGREGTPIDPGELHDRIAQVFDRQRRILSEHLIPRLARQGIRIVHHARLSARLRADLGAYFEQEVFPLLTPQVVDAAHPFPRISSHSVNLAVELLGALSERRFARIKIPATIPCLLPVELARGRADHPAERRQTFVWLDQLVAANLSLVFPGIQVLGAHAFRVVRLADGTGSPEDIPDGPGGAEERLRPVRFGKTVLLQVESTMPEDMRALLASTLNVGPAGVYEMPAPLDVTGLADLRWMDREDSRAHPLAGLRSSMREVGRTQRAVPAAR
jgi:polyphosphate kinase